MRPAVLLGLSYGALGAARSLGRLGVPVHAVTGRRVVPAARSRYVRGVVRLELRPDTLGELQALGHRLGRPVLIPTEDHSALFVADHADALHEAFVFPEQPPGVARAVSDKRSLFEVCSRLGVPTPATSFPQSRSDVLAFLADAVFPVVVKGIDGSRLERRTGVKTAVVVNDSLELLAAYDRLEDPEVPNLLLQEFIPGGIDASWMFNGYFGDGSECLFGLTARKLRMYPPTGGVTTLGVCVPNGAVAEAACGLMKELGYRGILDCGWRFDARDGRYKVFDVNPRVGATFRLFVDSNGCDVVRALYRDLAGEPVAAGRPLPGRKWLLESHDLMPSFRYWRGGTLRPRSWLRSYRGVQELAWWSRDDPLPLFSMCLTTLARLVALPFRRLRPRVLREPAPFGLLRKRSLEVDTETVGPHS